MTNAQEWLDKEYPLERRKSITKLTSNKFLSLDGELEITNFPKLEKIDFSNNSLVSLKLINLPMLSEIICNKNGDSLKKLTINNCPEISSINCSFNYLESLDFLSDLNQEKMIYLDISKASGCPPQKLSVFKEFINLEQLLINANPGGHSNSFYGSLKNLEELSKLKILEIKDNLNIDSDLEWLPANLEKIFCWSCRALEERLKECYDGGYYYNYQDWRKKNYENIITFLKEELQMEREEAEKALQKAKEWRERQLAEIAEQKDKEIEKLKKQVSQLQSQLDNLQVQEQQAQIQQANLPKPGNNN